MIIFVNIERADYAVYTCDNEFTGNWKNYDFKNLKLVVIESRKTPYYINKISNNSSLVIAQDPSLSERKRQILLMKFFQATPIGN